MDIHLQEFKISTYNNEDGQQKTTKGWIYNKQSYYAGKISLDNIIVDLNYKGLDLDYSKLPTEEFKGDIGNLRDFMYKEHKFPQNFIQEIKENDKQFFYMTNNNFELKNSEKEINENDNFMDGDIKIEIVCVRNS